MATRFWVALLLTLGTASWLHAVQTPSADAAAEQKKTVQKNAGAGGTPNQTPAKAKPADAAKQGKYFEERESVDSAATAQEVVGLLGNPKPFELQASGHYILIYCRATSIAQCDSQSKLLSKIKTDIDRLTGKAPAGGPKPAASSYQEIRVPHAAALGNVADAAKSLSFSCLQIDPVGKDTIRVSKKQGASQCDDYEQQLKDFAKDLDHLAWQIEPESPVARVYYVDAGNASAALGVKQTTPPPTPSATTTTPPPANQAAPSKATDQNASGNQNAGSNQSGGQASDSSGKNAGAQQGGSNTGSGTGKGKGNAGSGAGKGKGGTGASGGKGKGNTGGGGSPKAQKATPEQNNAQQQTPGGDGGATQTGGNQSAANQSAGNQSAANQSAGNQSAANQNGAKGNSGNGQQNPPGAQTGQGDNGNKGDGGSASSGASDINIYDPDLLIFTEKNPGDDSQVAERKRILAGIDFPRPEVIINTFSFQLSSSDSAVLAYHDQILRSRIGAYNDSIQAALYRAWFYLEARLSTGSGFFDSKFYDYVIKRFVGNTSCGSKVVFDTGKNPTCGGASPTGYSEKQFCGPDSYCLGYASLFHPLRPTLTDMLFAGVASRNPGEVFRKAMEQMQGFKYDVDYPDVYVPRPAAHVIKNQCSEGFFCTLPPSWQALPCDQKDIEAWKRPEQLPSLPSPKEAPGSSQSAETSDASTLDTARQIQKKRGDQKSRSLATPDIFPMFCFREAVEAAYPVAPSSDQYSDINVGLPLRAALANFLFQYKMAQQYPHEFSAYDLSQSAQELNSELNPFIVAFNRDLAAALQPLEEVANCDTKGNSVCRGRKAKTEFVDNGIVTVRTISGQKTSVDTVTQNFFDATKPPSITDVVNSIGKAESNVPNVLKTNLTANEAAVIIGALNSVPQTTAKVGREFKINVTPRSLSGASSAELNVHLETSDVGTPTRYSSEKTEEDNLSRIASQTVDTKVRLESVKLFDISSFTATLERSRENFPILPPLVTIPYFGSFLSWPVKGATQFHRSTAIMSAVIVPTAADLANGVAFNSDRVCAPTPPGGSPPPPCTTRRALSLGDVDGGAAIREFNKMKLRCFATASHQERTDLQCDTLTFSNLPRLE